MYVTLNRFQFSFSYILFFMLLLDNDFIYIQDMFIIFSPETCFEYYYVNMFRILLRVYHLQSPGILVLYGNGFFLSH